VAERLRGVRSSPIRDILALTEQLGVISFAGGLPAPELFDADGLRESSAPRSPPTLPRCSASAWRVRGRSALPATTRESIQMRWSLR
jgi:hypothetical protein